MTSELDGEKLFDAFMASADLKVQHRESGQHFSGARSELRRAFLQILTPLQDLLEDAHEARGVLESYGYGDATMPMQFMVRELVSRLIDAAGVTVHPTMEDSTETLDGISRSWPQTLLLPIQSTEQQS
jgi:hypothetical protein